MTDWIGLDKAIRPLRSLVADQREGAPLARAAATVAGLHFGEQALREYPALVNLGALAVQSRGMPATYLVRPSASQVVHETDLRAIPDEPPFLLRAAGIIEARRPDTGERLWGDIAALGWYLIKGADMRPQKLTDSVYLLGIRYPDGSLVAQWTPAWTGEDLVEQLPHEQASQSSLIDVVHRLDHYEFARAAARYLTIFGLLAEITNGPLRFELDSDGRTRQVRVSPKDLSARGLRQPPQSRPEPETNVDPLERVLGETPIKGHLQRFRVGKGRERVEWRYVDGYTGRRWFVPRWTVERDFEHGGLANDTLTFRGKK